MRSPRLVRNGVLALVKSALVVVGVPLSLLELWRTLPPLSAHPLTDQDLWMRVVIVVVGLLWLVALRRLLRDLGAALKGNDATDSSWSARWAGAIAMLVFLLSGSHLLGPSPTVGSPPTTALSAASSAEPGGMSGQLAVVHPGECLADLAEHYLGTRDAWVRLARLNYGLRQSDGGRLVDPNLLRTGWCVVLPPDATARPAPAPAVRGSDAHRELDELALLGLGILTSAALVRRLAALRATARSSRNVHERLRPPEEELARLHSAISPLGEAPLVDWIDLANRLLGMVATREGARPEPALVQAGPNGVVFHLREAVDCDTTPFRSEADGARWRLPLAASPQRLRTAAAAFPRWAPWLLPLGDDGDDAWLIALAPGDWLSLDGAPEDTQRLLDGLLMALRTLPWAEELQVELLGIVPPPPTERCYQLVASSPALLTELLVEPRRHRHDEEEVAPWRRELMAVFGPGASVTREAREHRERVALLSIGTEGSERLVVDGDLCVLEPSGLRLHAPSPDPAALRQIERLLDRAAVEPYYFDPSPPATGQERPLHGSLRLELLGGEPYVIGLSELVSGRDEARVVELLAYLALHELGATREELEAALFPLGGPNVHKRLTEILAATRMALAAGGDLSGGYLSVGERIALTVTVRSDWVELLEQLEVARHAPAEEARELLEVALSSHPSAPRSPYRWMESEELVSTLRFSICDGWHQLGLLASAKGELDVAEAAVRAGLRVEPTSELLVRDLMVLRDSVRDAEGVLESYEQLENALVEIGGSEPTPVTRELFVQLTERTHHGG